MNKYKATLVAVTASIAGLVSSVAILGLPSAQAEPAPAQTTPHALFFDGSVSPDGLDRPGFNALMKKKSDEYKEFLRTGKMKDGRTETVTGNTAEELKSK